MFGDDTRRAREAMADTLERRYGIHDTRILAAMRKIPRHRFIPEEYRTLSDAYGDHPSPIGHGQTISQPFIVAYMTQCLAVKPGDRVLEIGTGSGYQQAVLAELGAELFAVEIVPELAARARDSLQALGYSGIHFRLGDGYAGWPTHAPYDAILATCAPPTIPAALIDQLDSEHGRMILPVGRLAQRLVIVRKERGETRKEEDLAVRFVPMVRAGGPGDDDGC